MQTKVDGVDDPLVPAAKVSADDTQISTSKCVSLPAAAAAVAVEPTKVTGVLAAALRKAA